MLYRGVPRLLQFSKGEAVKIWFIWHSRNVAKQGIEMYKTLSLQGKWADEIYIHCYLIVRLTFNIRNMYECTIDQELMDAS